MAVKTETECQSQTVADLAPGESATICAIKGPAHLRQRLMDMGIIEGSRVDVIRFAPLGDPVQIRVYDTNIALRRTEARMLMIIRDGEPCHARKHCRYRFGRKSKLR